MLTFEGQQFQGAKNIVEKLTVFLLSSYIMETLGLESAVSKGSASSNNH